MPRRSPARTPSPDQSRWRRLSVGQQALLVVAHLRNGTTYAQLAAGFGIGTSTVYRYISEASTSWPHSHRLLMRQSGLPRRRHTSCSTGRS